ncbi:MAG: cytochrome c oxidase assembly protein [Nevskiaceae bacterium]|nr:MAG: cytochrome c oxidase assembly protein [Nevskiaceae bacterium]
MTPDADPQREKRQHLWRLGLLVAAMFGFGFLLGPMYSAICEATGVNGRMKVVASNVKAGEIDTSRTVTVEFVTTVNGSPLWQFSPEQPRIKVHPGQLYTVSFYAKNLQDQDLVAQAVPNIAPGTAAPHLRKTECFCFNQQPFKAGEAKHMPVRFMLDPALPPGIETVTLSYTFFDVTKLAQQSASRPKS